MMHSSLNRQYQGSTVGHRQGQCGVLYRLQAPPSASIPFPPKLQYLTREAQLLLVVIVSKGNAAEAAASGSEAAAAAREQHVVAAARRSKGNGGARWQVVLALGASSS